MSSQGGDVSARRPSELLRFIGSGSVSLKGISMPFYYTLSNVNQSEFNVNSPLPIDQNIFDYIRNPINSIGLQPKFKQGSVMIGTYVPRFTSYTTGDTRAFGVGLDANFNKLRVAFHAGNSQMPIPETAYDGAQGAYARRQYTGKIGIGKDNESHLHFALMKSMDIKGSVPDFLSTIKPQDNTVANIDYRLDIGKNFHIIGEVAGSGFTENTLEQEVENENIPRTLSSLLLINITTRMGAASKISLNRTGKTVSFKIYGDYITEGFRSLGYPFLQSDQINYRIEPTFNLMQGKVNISSAIGQRINNVSNAKAATTKQLTGMLNVGWMVTQNLNLNVSYTNFGMRNVIRNDTLRVDNVNNTFSITPSYTINAAKNTHVFSTTFTLDSFRDFNLVSGNENDNNMRTLLLSYMLSWNDKPLSINATAMNTQNEMTIFTMNMTSLTTGANYSFLENKMQTGLAFTFANNKIDDNDPSQQVMTRINMTLKPIKKLTFRLEGSINTFQFGEERPGVSFRETLLRTSLIYQIK